MKWVSVLVVIAMLQAAPSSERTLDPSQASWHQRYAKQKNAPDPAKMLLNTDAEPDLTTGFVDLFNGKDLTGWSPKGGSCRFEVSDGVILSLIHI